MIKKQITLAVSNENSRLLISLKLVSVSSGSQIWMLVFRARRSKARYYQIDMS
ncbi:MAG: hypothetical protein PHY70_05930 [Methanocellales archaeon]|nr:hypothetical protein [Methanocellales archaeon]